MPTGEDYSWPTPTTAVEDAYSQIMASHVLATLRARNDMSLGQVAERRGVSKPAVHQLENRPPNSSRRLTPPWFA